MKLHMDSKVMEMSVNRKVRNETRKLKERVEHDIDRNVSVEGMLERCHNQFLKRRRSSFSDHYL
jgi:hypothetical protein